MTRFLYYLCFDIHKQTKDIKAGDIGRVGGHITLTEAFLLEGQREASLQGLHEWMDGS